MTHIEDEYKKNFKDQELDNDGFDTEGLWDSIADDLGETQVITGISKGRYFLLLLIFLLGMSVSGLYFYITSDQEIVAIETTYDQIKNNDHSFEPSEVVQPVDQLSTKNNEHEFSDKPNPTRESSTENVSAEAGAILKQNSLANLIDENKLSRKGTKATLDPSKKQKIKQATIPSDPQTKQLAIPNKTAETMKVELPNNANDQNSISSAFNPSLGVIDKPINNVLDSATKESISNEGTYTQLPSLKYGLSQTLPTYRLDLELSKYANDSSRNTASVNKWEVGAWGGLNTINSMFSSTSLADLAALKEQAENGDLGMSWGLSLMLKNKEIYLFRTGVEYHQLWSKLDYKQVNENQVLKEQQLLKIWIDKSTGDTIKTEFGDVAVDAVATRHVVHHNSYQQISIPVEFGVQQKKQNLVYGITAGGVFNFTFSQSGKTVDKNSEIIEFDQSNSSALYKPFSVGIRVSPFVGYYLSEKMTLKVQPQWSLVSRSNYDGSDLGLNVNQFNLNVGVGYTFN